MSDCIVLTSGLARMNYWRERLVGFHPPNEWPVVLRHGVWRFADWRMGPRVLTDKTWDVVLMDGEPEPPELADQWMGILVAKAHVILKCAFSSDRV